MNKKEEICSIEDTNLLKETLKKTKYTSRRLKDIKSHVEVLRAPI